MKKLAFSALTFAVAAALGASSAHSIKLDKPAVISGAELKPGEYKLEVNGDRVTISNKKASVDATAQVETTTGEKFRATTMCCVGDDGKYNLQEIRVGGTNQKLVLSNQPVSTK
jgi:hypothetical protein